MPSNGSTTSQLFGQLSEFMEEIAAEKTAADDPGGYQGASTHPSADADDSTQEAAEGARSAENTSDVKSDIDGTAVDNLDELSPDKDEQDNRQLNIGTNQSATGEDAAVEDDYKGEKEDPGSEHPAKTDDGEKYGSLEEKYAAMSFEDARSRALELGNEILASLATGASTKSAEAAVEEDTKEAEAADEEPAAEADPEATEAAEAGYKLAAVIGMEELTDEQRAQASISETIKEAALDADLVGSYLAELATAAEAGASEKSADMRGGGLPPELAGMAGGGELPPELAGMAGGGELPPELMDPTAGGAEGDIEGEPSGMEEGGEPGGEELGEEDIAAALGGMEGPPEEEMGGGVGDDEALQELAMALDELGISPEELAAAASEGGGMAPEAAMESNKLAAAVKGYKRAGKFQLKEATSGRERKIRDLMKAHVMELVG